MNPFFIRELVALTLLFGALGATPGMAQAALAGGEAEPGEQMMSEAPPAPAAGPVVRINSANAKTLQTLYGVGPRRARAILHYRKLRGPFRSEQDLLKVRGIAEDFLKRNRGRLRWD